MQNDREKLTNKMMSETPIPLYPIKTHLKKYKNLSGNLNFLLQIQVKP